MWIIRTPPSLLCDSYSWTLWFTSKYMYYANNPTFLHSPSSTFWIDWVNGFICNLTRHALMCTCAFPQLVSFSKILGETVLLHSFSCMYIHCLASFFHYCQCFWQLFLHNRRGTSKSCNLTCFPVNKLIKTKLLKPLKWFICWASRLQWFKPTIMSNLGPRFMYLHYWARNI